MITVGIIGILVGIAVPRYERYQRKARQSEAKIGIGAIFALQKAFYSEYSSYIPAFDSIGYTPEGHRRFYITNACWGADGGNVWAGSVTGYSGTSSVRSYSRLRSPVTTGTYTASSSCTYAINVPCASIGSDPQSMLPYMWGSLYEGGESDVWAINSTKKLENCNSGL